MKRNTRRLSLRTSLSLAFDKLLRQTNGALLLRLKLRNASKPSITKATSEGRKTSSWAQRLLEFGSGWLMTEEQQGSHSGETAGMIDRLKAWVTANERTKWATRLSFLLSPRKMIEMWRQWNQERDRAIVEELKKKINQGWAYLYLIAWVCLVFLSAYAVNRPPKYPIETHHNVYVWSKVQGAKETWWVSSSDLPFNTWNCCPDFPCSTVIWPGYVAATLRYEERGTCKSIRAAGLGIWWKTDEHGNVKEW